MIQLDWAQIKTVASQRTLTLHWVLFDDRYRIWAVDNQLLFETQLLLVQTTEVAEFEATYKTPGNKSPVQNSVVQTTPAFGSKTVVINNVTKKLYARNHGVQQALSVGSNTVSYTITYPWVKIIGVEVVNSEALDYVDFKVKDNSIGTYSGTPNAVLNQFAYSHNIPKEYYIRTAQFDADIYVGMVIEVTYTSSSAKTIGLNFIMNEVKT